VTSYSDILPNSIIQLDIKPNYFILILEGELVIQRKKSDTEVLKELHRN